LLNLIITTRTATTEVLNVVKPALFTDFDEKRAAAAIASLIRDIIQFNGTFKLMDNIICIRPFRCLFAIAARNKTTQGGIYRLD